MKNLKQVRFMQWIGYPLFIIGIQFTMYFIDEATYNLGMAISGTLRLLGYYLVGIFLGQFLLQFAKEKAHRDDD